MSQETATTATVTTVTATTVTSLPHPSTDASAVTPPGASSRVARLGTNADHERSWAEWLYEVRYPAIFVTLAVLLFLGIGYYQSTLVTGTEMNTQTLDLRKFQYRRDPFTHYQLTGITHDVADYSLAWTGVPASLLSQIDPVMRTYMTAPNLPTARWDLVSFNIGGRGDAKILVDLISSRDNAFDSVWSKWTGNQPIKAAAFWPAVQELTSLRMYDELPKLFYLARRDLSDAEFQEELVDLMLSLIVERCRQWEQFEHGDIRLSEAAAIGQRYGDDPILDQSSR